MVFKKEEKTYVVTSGMEGFLYQGGEPLVNMKITRRLRWTGVDDFQEQYFYTDEKGFFSLPIHEEVLSMSKIAQFVSNTIVEVEIDGESHMIWYNTKFESELFSEFGGESVGQVVCDINNEEKRYELKSSTVVTVCRWENMPENK
ncbi:hypothetical protein GCM10007877_18080 [Marinibactrum halimedae]|uniref:DUF6795 domain-containing protein n=2 Tax=Marinibactrum halimedae TaxID=1444977 RepID=A0AA37T3K1_9GAMM|nr:hypothetical protein GCM10007877_18080 [Marinibactrum halimedae]